MDSDDVPSHNRSCLSWKVVHTIKKIDSTYLGFTAEKRKTRIMSMFLSYVFTIFVVFTACVDF